MKDHRKYFAIVSGYDDKTSRIVENELVRLGLDYQIAYGRGFNDNCFVVWNTAYALEPFQQIAFKLSKSFKQSVFCIGCSANNGYKVNLWKTESIDDIDYSKSIEFFKTTVADVLKEINLISNRTCDIKLGEINSAVCTASSESMCGGYVRKSLVQNLLKIPDYFNMTPMEKELYEQPKNKGNDAFAMTMASKEDTGLPYDFWIYNKGAKAKGNSRAHIIVQVFDNPIPILVSDEPDIAESAKQSGIKDFPYLTEIKEYVKAYAKILIAHYYDEITDKKVLTMLSTIDKANDYVFGKFIVIEDDWL